MDDDVAPAVLDLQRSNKRSAIHLAWLGPLICGPSTGILIALVASREREQGMLSLTSQALMFTVPLAAVFFGAAAYWSYNAADQRERRLLEQLGEPADRRSPMVQAANTVGRAAIALLMGLVLTLLAMLPVRALVFLVSLLGVPIDAIPQEVGLAAGTVAVAVAAVLSYRWLRANPSSPLRLENRTDR